MRKSKFKYIVKSKFTVFFVLEIIFLWHFIYAYHFIVKNFWIKLGGVSFGSVQRNIPWEFLLIKRAWMVFGWTKPPCKENRGHLGHTESSESKISLRQIYICSVMWRYWVVTVLPQWPVWGDKPLLSLHGHGRRCRIWLKNIVIFTLFCDIFDQVWSLLKYWKYVNFNFTINLNCAFAFFYFLFYSK